MQSSHVLKFSSNEPGKTELFALLKEIRSGETAAFGKLYDLYFVKIYRFIYYRVSHKETAEDLAEEFGSIEKLMAASEEELFRVNGVGEKVARSIVSYFKEGKGVQFVEKLKKHGVVIETQKVRDTANLPLHGQTFVITGTLGSYGRDEAKDALKQLGASVSESVSKKTTAVIVGASPGSKADKAKALGVTILDEQAFLELLKKKEL